MKAAQWSMKTKVQLPSYTTAACCAAHRVCTLKTSAQDFVLSQFAHYIKQATKSSVAPGCLVSALIYLVKSKPAGTAPGFEASFRSGQTV